MKVFVEIDTEKNSYEDTITVVNKLYNKKDLDKNQTKLEDNTKKYFCNNPDCKKEITKDVVAFCLHEDNRSRFNGKVYCRECQKNYGGASA